MQIEDKLDEGYIVACDCKEFFLAPRLGISVECPHCGQVELPANILAVWVLNRPASCRRA